MGKLSKKDKEKLVTDMTEAIHNVAVTAYAAKTAGNAYLELIERAAQSGMPPNIHITISNHVLASLEPDQRDALNEYLGKITIDGLSDLIISQLLQRLEDGKVGEVLEVIQEMPPTIARTCWARTKQRLDDRERATDPTA